jgi:hypothetical protein
MRLATVSSNSDQEAAGTVSRGLIQEAGHCLQEPSLRLAAVSRGRRGLATVFRDPVKAGHRIQEPCS